jgi:hypothetical protein
MRAAVLLAAGLLLLAPAALAQGEGGGNPFSQRGVPAEASAENGVLARERALAAGRRAAWQRLTGQAGGGPNLSDSQIEDLVDSIVIEQERVTPQRYTGQITVNFNPGRVRGARGGERTAALTGGAAAAAPPPGGGGTSAAPPVDPLAPLGAARPGGPASTWLTAVATYRSMEEWLELQRRLRGAGPVASLEIQGIATDRARLRLGLRAPGPVAAEELAGLGVVMQPMTMGMGPDQTWAVGLGRAGLAGGG